MGFVQLDMTKTKELEIHAEGEYELTCVSMDTEDTSKKGDPMISAAFRAHDENVPNGELIREWFSLPNPRDAEVDAEKGLAAGTTSDAKIRKLKRMLFAFGIPFTPEGFEGEDIVGETTKMKVFIRQEPITEKKIENGREVYKETGQMANRISWPRFKGDKAGDEAETKGRRGPPAPRRR